MHKGRATLLIANQDEAYEIIELLNSDKNLYFESDKDETVLSKVVQAEPQFKIENYPIAFWSTILTPEEL